jgi:hypothetical protein
MASLSSTRRTTTLASRHTVNPYQRTELASGQILTGAILSIWLVQLADKPESVVVMWPQRPTAVSPSHYSDLAATVCRLVANASTELAAINAGKRM